MTPPKNLEKVPRLNLESYSSRTLATPPCVTESISNLGQLRQRPLLKAWHTFRMRLTPWQSIVSSRYTQLCPCREAALILVVSEENVVWADHVVPPVTLCAITLLPIQHHVDTLAVWAMDRYRGHHVLRGTRGQRGHATSMATPLEY